MRARLAATVAAVLAAAPAATAAGAVVIGPRTIAVAAPGAHADVHRSPFRLSVHDGRGRRVLAEVGDAAVAPPLAVRPGGVDDPADLRRPALYAPLPFIVGTQTLTTVPVPSFIGNLLASHRAGTEYAARRVVSARRAGRGVRLLVATSDPAGRRLVVTVGPRGRRAIRVTARVSPSAGVVALGDAFVAGRGEAFRGFGGRHNALDQRGRAFYDWTEEENVSADTSGPPPQDTSSRELAPNGATASYLPQGLFVSSRPYGFLLEPARLQRFRLASDRPDAWRADVASSRLAYTVAPGSTRTAIGTLTAISGRHRLPPAWATGAELDRNVHTGAERDTPATYRRVVARDIADIDAYRFAPTMYRFEGWGYFSRAQLRATLAALRRRHIHPLLYFKAFVSERTLGLERPGAFAEAVRRGYVARHADGRPYRFPSVFGQGDAALVDFTNPAAVRWWRGRIREVLDLGADGFMQDFGEQVLPDMVFHDGRTGRTMHNAYPALYHRATRRIVDAWEREHPGRDVFFFTRSGFSGTPGSAAYENANFAGDAEADFTRANGLPSVIPDMLNRSIGGHYGYTTDIGGYLDLLGVATTRELLLRWAEVAALTPFFRLHNSPVHGTRMPWAFGRRTLAVYERYRRLHDRARPLIRRLWRHAVRTGVPPTRPLWLEFPGDPRAARQEQEFMLGSDMLAAPVVGKGDRGRPVYLPRGCWRRAGAGAAIRGPAARAISAPLASLPYYVRCGTHPLAGR